MSNNQKQISISITKIFNWGQDNASCTFNLIFYTDINSPPIIEKTIAGIYQSGTMNLNAYLKITYTQQQKMIILELSKRDANDILGTFQIDLEMLKKKKVQYFPFGNESVLQINLYSPEKSRLKTKEPEYKKKYVSNDNEKFISQREQNLQKRFRASRSDGNKMERFGNRKQFEKKVMALLDQVKSMKKQSERNTQAYANTGQRQRISENYVLHQQRRKKLQKSSSDPNLLRKNKFSSNHQQTAKRKSRQLVLSNLQVVSGDYYPNGLHHQYYQSRIQ